MLIESRMIMNQEKINELKIWMNQEAVDVAYITNPTSIAYLSGFTSDPHERVLALFISLQADPFLFTPALETESAKQSSWSYDVVGYLDTENPWQVIANELLTRYVKKQTIALEKNSLSLDRYEALSELLPTSDFSKDVGPVLQKLQLRKTKQEIDTMIEAGNWADVAFEIGFSAIKEGVKEKEIVAEIEYQLKRQGVSKMSFDTTVLVGPHAASPHGEPNDTPVKPNELVLFDLGVLYKGYCSDATRTVAYQEPTKFQEKIYHIVLEAQLAAQSAVKPGVTAHQLDKIARDVIESYGYKEAFNHRLGHGIGASIHEYPSIVAGNDLVIEEGMCFSIEPGIYLPDQIGVRIEDCIYVTEDGCKPFTKTSKELTIIQ